MWKSWNPNWDALNTSSVTVLQLPLSPDEHSPSLSCSPITTLSPQKPPPAPSFSFSSSNCSPILHFTHIFNETRTHTHIPSCQCVFKTNLLLSPYQILSSLFSLFFLSLPPSLSSLYLSPSSHVDLINEANTTHTAQVVCVCVWLWGL